MSISLEKIEHKATKEGKPFVRAQAKPGGWVSIWDAKDIALVKERGSGPYEGTIEEQGDFKNLSGLRLAEPPKDGAVAQPSTERQSEFRAPEQFIRTDAIRFAIESGTLEPTLAGAIAIASYITDGTVPPEPRAKPQAALASRVAASATPAPAKTIAAEALIRLQERAVAMGLTVDAIGSAMEESGLKKKPIEMTEAEAVAVFGILKSWSGESSSAPHGPQPDEAAI